MVRFKYGPWDYRYRKFLNILIARNLISVKIDKNTFKILLNDFGFKISEELMESTQIIIIDKDFFPPIKYKLKYTMKKWILFQIYRLNPTKNEK